MGAPKGEASPGRSGGAVPPPATAAAATGRARGGAPRGGRTQQPRRSAPEPQSRHRARDALTAAAAIFEGSGRLQPGRAGRGPPPAPPKPRRREGEGRRAGARPGSGPCRARAQDERALAGLGSCTGAAAASPPDPDLDDAPSTGPFPPPAQPLPSRRASCARLGLARLSEEKQVPGSSAGPISAERGQRGPGREASRGAQSMRGGGGGA